MIRIVKSMDCLYSQLLVRNFSRSLLDALLLAGIHHVQEPVLSLSQLLDTAVQALLPGHLQQPQQHWQGVPWQVLEGSCCLEPNVDLSMS